MKKHTKKLPEILRPLQPASDVLWYGAELGVWRGENAAHLLDSFPNLRLYLVDCYGTTVQQNKFFSERIMRDSENTAHENTAPYKDRIVWIRAETILAHKQIWDQSLDFVYIDASHDFKSCFTDIREWMPKVKPGGILCGHDHNHRYPGVCRAVKRSFKGKAQIDKPTSLWWIQI